MPVPDTKTFVHWAGTCPRYYGPPTVLYNSPELRRLTSGNITMAHGSDRSRINRSGYHKATVTVLKILLCLELTFPRTITRHPFRGRHALRAIASADVCGAGGGKRHEMEA